MISKNIILEKLRRNAVGNVEGDALKASRTSSHPIPVIIPDKKIYSDYISGSDEKLQQFIERQKNLHGEVVTCISMDAMADALADLLIPFGTSSSKYFQNEIIDSIFQINPDIRNYFDMETDLSINSPDFSRYASGVSGAEYLIARTGSIFINSRMAADTTVGSPQQVSLRIPASVGSHVYAILAVMHGMAVTTLALNPGFSNIRQKKARSYDENSYKAIHTKYFIGSYSLH